MSIRPWGLCLLALLATVLCAQSPSAPSAPAQAKTTAFMPPEGLAPAELEVTTHSVAQMKVVIGHTTLVMENGAAAYVLQGGKRVGLYFRGKGNLEYLSTLKDEFPAAEYNLKKNATFDWRETEKGLRLKDTFTELLLRTSGGTLPVLDQPSTEKLDAGFKGIGIKLSPYVDVPFSHLLAQHAFQPNASAEWINAWGGEENLQIVFDKAVSFEERFEVLKPNREMFNKAEFPWHTMTISKQPIGWNSRQPIAPPFILNNVDLEVTAPAGSQVRLVATQTFDPAMSGQHVINLQLIHTKYEAHHTGGMIPHQYRVLSVKDDKGRSLEFHHDLCDELQVYLAESPAQHQPIKLRFEIEGDILFPPRGDSYWALGVENWMPLPRRMSGQAYKVHALVKVAKPFVPIAGGTTVRRWEENGYNLQEVRIDDPVQFFSIMGGKYKFLEETRNGQTVRIAFYSDVSNNAKTLMNLAFGVIAYYDHVLGPFPFKEFNIIQRNEFGYGQAPPGVMFITNEAFGLSGNEESMFLRMAYSHGVNQRFAHEIAHQYWGHELKMPCKEEQWITESFAEYCSSLVLANVRQQGPAKRDALIMHWKNRATEAKGEGTIPYANQLVDLNNRDVVFWTRFKLIYFKGAWLLNVIHKKVGDVAFTSILRTFLANHRWGFATTENFLETVNAVTKQDWRPFFEQNYWGLGMPEAP